VRRFHAARVNFTQVGAWFDEFFSHGGTEAQRYEQIMARLPLIVPCIFSSFFVPR
jgi:hypothetical protein